MATSGTQEVQHQPAQVLCMCGGKPVRCARKNFKPAAADHFTRTSPGRLYRNDPVGITMNDASGNIEFLEVRTEIRRTKGNDALLGAKRRRAPGNPLAECQQILAGRRCWIDVLEVREKLLQEGDAIFLHVVEHAVEHGLVEAIWIVVRLQQEGRYRA